VTTEFFGKADEALGIALYADKIIVAGKARNETDYLDFAVARYTNDVGVSVPGSAAIPGFSVSPNPVKRNGTSNLVYDLTQPERISFELVSITGNSVMTVPGGVQTAGNHTFQFSLPSSVSAGVYFLRITGSHGLNKTQKLVVIE
jgi:hypothetical protein